MSAPIPVGTLVAPTGLPGAIDIQTGPGLRLDTSTVPTTIDVATPYLPIAGGQITGSLGIGTTAPAGAVNALIAGGPAAAIIADNVVGNAYFDGTNWRYLINGDAWLVSAYAGNQWRWLYGGSGSAGGVASFTTMCMTLNGYGALQLSGGLTAGGNVSGAAHFITGGASLVPTDQNQWPGGVAIQTNGGTYGFSMQASVDPAFQWYGAGRGVMMSLNSGASLNVAGNVACSGSLISEGYTYPAGGTGWSVIVSASAGGWSWSGGQGGYAFQHIPNQDPVFRFNAGSTMLFYINSNGSIAASNGLTCGFINTNGISCTSINTNGNNITLGTLSASGNVNGHDFVVNGTGIYYTSMGVGGYYQARWDGSSFYYWVNNYGFLGPLFTPSGRAVKRNIKAAEIADALTPICAIPWYSYDAPEAGKPNDDDGNWTGIAHHQLGWVAEDLEELIPNSVVRLKHQTDPTQPEVLGPQWMPILTYAVRAIQQLAQQNTALEARLATLEGRTPP